VTRLIHLFIHGIVSSFYLHATSLFVTHIQPHSVMSIIILIVISHYINHIVISSRHLPISFLSNSFNERKRPTLSKSRGTAHPCSSALISNPCGKTYMLSSNPFESLDGFWEGICRIPSMRVQSSRRGCLSASSILIEQN